MRLVCTVPRRYEVRKFKANKRMIAARKMIEENEGCKFAPQGAQFDGEGCQYLGTRFYFVKILPEYVLRKVPVAEGEAMGLPKMAVDFFSNRQFYACKDIRVTLGELEDQVAGRKVQPNPILRIGRWLFNPVFVVSCMEVLGADHADLEFNMEVANTMIVVRTDKGTGFVAPYYNSNEVGMDEEEYVPLSMRCQRG